MSLNKRFFERETLITAKVIADSINETGQRLTTFELEFPRLILSECNTHGAIEKNTSSSRAIPVSKMLDHILEQNLKPIYFGSKKSGMQAGEELESISLEVAKGLWEDSLEKAVFYADQLDALGVAKEVTNRITEPYQLIKAVWSATDWDNWFNLRLEKDADPNICMLAYKMYEAMSKSVPTLLKKGEYHLPYVDSWTEKDTGKKAYSYVDNYGEDVWVNLQQAIKYSVACCASVSYRATDMTLEKADKIWNMLVKSEVVHSSPLTHIATPIVEYTDYFDPDDLDTGYEVNLPYHPDSWEKGVTHMRRDGTLCSGRFAGWIQKRHLIENNTCWNFNFEDRMKSFD